MKILFYFGHPAQYLFLRGTLRFFVNNEIAPTIVLIKTKDVLEDLIKSDGFSYINIQKEERAFTKVAIFLGFVKRLLKILWIVVRHKPTILVGTDATIAIAGWLTRRSVITVLEDDYLVIKKLADLCYPYTSVILCPQVCDVDRWENKKIGYAGYMKLGYLHPNLFDSDPNVILKYSLPQKFVLIRVAKLSAHHDFGEYGLTKEVLHSIISIIKKNNFNVFISSEAKLDEVFSEYQINVEPRLMHHILAQASLLVCDSQSMSVEAAVLGVPSIRYSSFKGKISVLEELEHNYLLTFAVKAGDTVALESKISELLSTNNLSELFNQRRTDMLKDKIDVNAFMIWFIKNYPHSVVKMKEDPDYQYNFR